MNKSKQFIKVEYELLDNKVLSPTQKCLLLLLRRLETAPKGCTPSHTYLMKRTALKSRKTLIRHLDKLQFLGYVTWKNRGKGKSNLYIFRDNPEFQSTLLHNHRLRSKMSREQKEIYQARKLTKGFKDKKVILLKAK